MPRYVVEWVIKLVEFLVCNGLIWRAPDVSLETDHVILKWQNGNKVLLVEVYESESIVATQLDTQLDNNTRDTYVVDSLERMLAPWKWLYSPSTHEDIE